MARITYPFIPCIWNHPDCKCGTERIRKGEKIHECNVLIDNDFPNRTDCPFYKPGVKRNKITIPDSIKEVGK